MEKRRSLVRALLVSFSAGVDRACHWEQQKPSHIMSHSRSTYGQNLNVHHQDFASHV